MVYIASKALLLFQALNKSTKKKNRSVKAKCTKTLFLKVLCFLLCKMSTINEVVKEAKAESTLEKAAATIPMTKHTMTKVPNCGTKKGKIESLTSGKTIEF